MASRNVGISTESNALRYSTKAWHRGYCITHISLLFDALPEGDSLLRNCFFTGLIFFKGSGYLNCDDLGEQLI